MSKTIRMVIPDWQSGNNSVYYFGAQLLNWLAPENSNQKTIKVPIAAPKSQQTPLKQENGVTAQSTVIESVKQTQNILTQESPDKIITLGGNCMVSQAPFSYLHEKYGDDLGIIWIDAHPDISTPQIFPNEHAMVLANLMGQGDPALSKYVKKPFSNQAILYVGLQEPTADEKKIFPKLGLDYQIEDNHQVDPRKIQDWVNTHNFSKIVIHFDIDVLDPQLFFDQFFDKPGVKNYDVSNGKMSPNKAIETLKYLNDNNNLVGLTIAEYLPWSALKLQEMMKQLSIFN